MKKLLVLGFFSSLFFLQGFAQQEAQVNMAPIDLLDSLVAQYNYKLRYPTKKDTQAMNIHRFAPDAIPTYDPSVYKARLRELPFIFPMDYNEKVQSYIEVYGMRKRKLTSKLLGLQYVYFPIIEEVLRKEGVPIELKYLAAIESAFSPKAVSWANAVGLWQIILGTAKLYNLRVDSYVDERLDPYKSTVAAARFLKDLYAIYGDWKLVIAAYNCGPGNVNRAVRRCNGSMDFWELSCKHLPRETSSYVPAFIGCAYVMNYHKEHNLYPIYTDFTYQQDTMSITGYKVRLDKLAEAAEADPELLKLLNPQLIQGVVPFSSSPYTIRVPEKVATFYKRYPETLAAIAEPEKYAAKRTTEPLKNFVPRNSPKPLPTLIEQPPAPAASAKEDKPTVINLTTVASTENTTSTEATQSSSGMAHQVNPNSQSNNQKQYHRVQSGDSLWIIAQKYSGLTVDKLLKMNNLTRYSTLQVGQLIRLTN